MNFDYMGRLGHTCYLICNIFELYCSLNYSSRPFILVLQIWYIYITVFNVYTYNGSFPLLLLYCNIEAVALHPFHCYNNIYKSLRVYAGFAEKCSGKGVTLDSRIFTQRQKRCNLIQFQLQQTNILNILKPHIFQNIKIYQELCYQQRFLCFYKIPRLQFEFLINEKS